MALFPLVGGIGGKLSDFGAQLIGKGFGLGPQPKLPPISDYNKQVQAAHAESVAKNAAALRPASPTMKAPPAPRPAAPQPPAALPSLPAASAPVSPSPSSGVAPASPASSAPQLGPVLPPTPTPLETAEQAYLKTLSVSPEMAATSAQLGTVASQQATDVQKAQQEYADRVKAIEEQATLQPFLTGRETQAQGQLANQMAAIQAASQAQTIPLQQQLANLQAQREAQQQQAQAELGFVQPKTESVAPGQTIIDPRTGQVIYKSPEKPITVAAGAQLVDPTTGKVISSTPSKPVSLSATGTLVDPLTGKVIAQGTGASLGGMSQGAIDTAAQQYLLTGQMPTLGIGGATAKVAILNKAADLAAANGQDAQSLALQKAAFKSGQSELTKLMGQQGPVMAFENTAKANLDQALNLSNQVDRSGSPVVNRWLLKLKGQYAGDPQVASFEAATETAANEYAKVVSSATGGGVTTDSARNQAMGLLNTAQTPEQFASVVNQLKVEMENRRKGMEQEIQNIQQQMLGAQSQGGATADDSSSGGFNW